MIHFAAAIYCFILVALVSYGIYLDATSAAVCLNWHMSKTVGTNMRPGIEPPQANTGGKAQ